MYKLIFTAAVLLGIFGLVLVADWWIAVPPNVVPQYVGRQTCAQCHQKQYEQWQDSHHDLAMDLATDDTVLADFDDQRITYRSAGSGPGSSE